jgi:hypothetical protein
MASKFDDLLLRGVKSGHMPARTNDSRKWFRQEAKKLKMKPTKIIRETPEQLRSQSVMGKLFHFYYDPKHKKTLPYYDTFPLVFPFRKVKGGFYGINMHYLPLPLRARLMDALYELSSDNRYDENTKLKLTYKILEGSSKFKWFKPCVKHYLTPHVRSRFMEIHPSHWDIVLFLPSDAFEKAKRGQVWADSRKIIKGGS